jgi:hypothetical protein
MKRVFLVIFLLFSLAVLFPRAVFAATDKSACDFLTDPDKGKCISCMGGNKEKVWTAFGCLSTTATGKDNFAETLLKFGSGIAGGIAFLLIIVGGFQIVMSAGNPEKLNEGKELVTSAIVGLLFIIFSIFLLRLIGVDILGIPGFE